MQSSRRRMLASPVLYSSSAGLISSHLSPGISRNSHNVRRVADKGPQFAIGEVVNREYRVRAVEEDAQGRIIHRVRVGFFLLLDTSPLSARGCRMAKMSSFATKVATGRSVVRSFVVSKQRRKTPSVDVQHGLAIRPLLRCLT